MIRWDDKLWLLTHEEFDSLDEGTQLLSINNSQVTKGKDFISKDVRMGVLAYGLTKELAEQQGLGNKFAIMLLKS